MKEPHSEVPGKSPVGFRYVVTGRVQGVGFRDFVQRQAQKLNLVGYVRNLPDGSVLVGATGPRERLSELEALLRRGPVGAQVSSVTAEEMNDLGLNDFRIVP